MQVSLQKSDKLYPGERLIVVDGEAWGRTIISHHGCHGTRHVFHQEHGETIGDVSNGGYFHAVEVRSQKRRKWLGDRDDWRPTEDKVLEKVRELIAGGRLRHPDLVKKEQAELRKRMAANTDRRERAERAEFEAKAREALGVNDDGPSEIVDRVVAAMRWAQSQ